MDSTTARLLTCFATVFPEHDHQELLQATPESIPEWDSLASVTLLALVAEEFGVTLDMEGLEDDTSFPGILRRLAAPGR